MGFVSKGLISGILRRRSFRPIEAKIMFAREVWPEREDIISRVSVFRSGGDRQYLYLTRNELHAVFPLLLETADIKARQGMAKSLLSGFEDAALLDFLKELLADRQKASLE